MKRTLFAAAAALALFTAGPTLAQAPAPAAPPATTAASEPVTPAGAKAFVERAEAELSRLGEIAGRASWVRATNITYDTQILDTYHTGRFNEAQSRYGAEAARFNSVQADPVTRRKLYILKSGITQPSSKRPGAADETAALATKLDSIYSTGKFTYNGKTLTLNDAEDILRTSRDPAELKAVYEGWRTVSPVMRSDYAKFAAMMNEGARELGYADTGALWRSGYDMPADDFAKETDRLWAQVRPFYQNLHCYVRTRLNDKYGDAVQPKTGAIRADLLGNMWAQQWGNIEDIVAPKTGSPGVDLNAALTGKGYDPVRMVKTGEGFYTSLGLAPLPATFWERSQITRPRDREVVCHASAWDLDSKDDIRIKMCTQVNGDDFYTVHHELGHNYYQRAYQAQPYLFQNGANDGFHEAIGDFVGLSALTPTYLQQIKLIDGAPPADADTAFLLNMALDKIAFLPFGLLVDRWRWEVFNGKITEAQYNDRWWQLVNQYQGLVPPGARPADAFDPGAKYHVPGNTPYTRYFLAHIYQFQFQRAACKQAGWTGPLHRCSVYGNKEVGQRLNAMLEQGASKPWPEVLKTFTGETRTDASAVTDYFAPLNVWLTAQNKGQRCGW